MSNVRKIGTLKTQIRNTNIHFAIVLYINDYPLQFYEKKKKNSNSVVRLKGYFSSLAP